jgi:hypothetical protein
MTGIGKAFNSVVAAMICTLQPEMVVVWMP